MPKNPRACFFYLSVVLLICSAVIYVSVAVRSFPDHIFLFNESLNRVNHTGLFSARIDNNAAVTVNMPLDTPVFEENASLTLSLLGVPVKNVPIEVLPETWVVPVGLTVGIRIDTVGLMVLGSGSVTLTDGTTSRPAEDKVKSGDILLKIDGIEIKDHRHFIKHLDSIAPGSDVELTVKRNGQLTQVTVTCAISADDGKNKLGLWIRDSTKGIGTITYYCLENKRFAALGHGVIDVDTKQLIPVKDGRLYQTDIVAVKKGKHGNPGELISEVNRNSTIGTITDNTEVGLFGTINPEIKKLPEKSFRIALQNEITEGPAIILSNVNGNEIRQYDIYIERVNRYAADTSKGMVIRITDQELITRTNGIVQGMSGCPIIQNGRVIGAVTHVFVQNPLKGYGIFIENMIRHDKR